jgi:hypothetical protein
MQTEKIQSTLRKAIADRGARTPEEREEVYAKARAVLARTATGNAAVQSALDAAIQSIEAEFAIQSTEAGYSADEEGDATMTDARASKSEGSRNIGNYLIGAAGGAVIAGAAVFGASAMGFGSSPAPSEEHAKFDQLYAAGQPYVGAAKNYLEAVRQAVVAMQKSDPAKLAPAEKTFVSLTVAMGNAAPKPPALPKGSYVIVRADAKNYKILMAGPLCATMQFASPEIVEPQRDAGVLGCAYFGLWSAGAQEW